MDTSAKSIWTSLALISFPLILYAEPDSLSILRVTSTTSLLLYSFGAFLSLLSRTNETSAKFLAGLFSVPEKITSSIEDVRIDLYDVSPIAHLRASTRFDLPQPLGPTTPVNPFPILTSTGSTKDLKFEIRNFLKSTFSSYLISANIS